MNSLAVRLIALSFLSAVCAGCAGTAADKLALADISSIAAEPRVTVFTTRNVVDGAKSRPWFGTERAKRPSVAEVRLSSPYDRGSFSLVAGDWGID